MEQDVTVLNIDPAVFFQLSTALNRDRNWKKFVTNINKAGEFFSNNFIEMLTLVQDPGDVILNEFGKLGCTASQLSCLLRESELYDIQQLIALPGYSLKRITRDHTFSALVLFTERMEVCKQPGGAKQSLLCKIGKPFELEFAVSGIPRPKFQWLKNGSVLENEREFRIRCEEFT